VSELVQFQKKLYLIKLRRDIAEVKPRAEKLDGMVAKFYPAWGIDDGVYNGEWAMRWADLNQEDWALKNDAPLWVASGDLIEMPEPGQTS
jgi:hypothetical protein